jgi:uncharacterized protein
MTVQAPAVVPIDLHMNALETVCRKWEIAELALFGSVLRRDFGPDSDVDVLVTFKAHAGWSLWDFLGLQDELANLLAREVDLVSRGALRNPSRRREILASRQVVFADADA